MIPGVAPVDRKALFPSRPARRPPLHKVGRVVRHDADRAGQRRRRSTAAHEDGLRVPVLVWGGVLVRGYTDGYEQALAHGPAPGERGDDPRETARSTYMDVPKIEWSPRDSRA
jgi:hypothetical protein